MYLQTQKDKLERLTDIYKCPLYFWSFSVLSGLSFEPENPLTSLHEMGAWVLALISVLAGDSPSPSLSPISPPSSPQPPSTSGDVFVSPSQRWRGHGVPHTDLGPGQRLTGLFISLSLCRFSGWFWAFGILSLQSPSELSGLERPGGLNIPPLTPGPQWAQSGLAEEHAIGTF